MNVNKPESLAQRWLSGKQILVCDGATGTMLHSAGVPLDRSLSELNVTRPGLVRDLHAAYLAAGARMVQTNTFDGNRLRLARVGLDARVAEINIAGARLAREAVDHSGTDAVVAGSVGPPSNATLVPRLLRSDRAAALREQISALADWVDVIVLETFGDIESLAQAVEIAVAECDLPVIAQMTFGDDGRTLGGEEPSAVATVLGQLDVAAIGANCTVGPAVLQEVVIELVRGCSLLVSVQPNAGLPRRLGRQLRYAHNVDYFAGAARQFVLNGAGIVGGCCGTTPAHIRAMAKAVADLLPAPRSNTAGRPAARPVLSVVAPAERLTPLASWPGAVEFSVVAAMRAPRGPEVAAFVAQAKQFADAGVDQLAIIDPDPPAAGVGPVAAAVLLRERLGAQVIFQMDTADRSLAALQADLLGAHALGLQVVICRTGTPLVAGDYPDPDLLWEVDAGRLIGVLAGLNDGVDWRGVTMHQRTEFSIGATLCTAASDVRQELDRAEANMRAGAHFLLTDAIYDLAAAQDMLTALRERGSDIPVIAAIAPFDDATAIARLTHEFPERLIPLPVATGPGPAGESPGRAVEVVGKLRDLVVGVLVHAPLRLDPRMPGLLEDLGRFRRAP